MSQNTLANPATAKQEAFITRLWKQSSSLDALNDTQQGFLKKVLAAEYIEKSDASYLIDGLMKCPKQERKMAAPGYYKDGENYLVVVENKSKTATYAKRLVVTKNEGGRSKARWVYAPGEGANVASVQPMTLEEAAKFGHLHGVCFVCCRALTDPESVKRGIGPVCATRIRR